MSDLLNIRSNRVLVIINFDEARVGRMCSHQDSKLLKATFMLIFTNRSVQKQKTDELAFTNRFTPLAESLSIATVKAKENGNGWIVSDISEKTSDVEAVVNLSSLLMGSKPVLVFVHGNNNSPSACFDRCLALEKQYEVNVIGFSWASEGFQPSGDDLADIDSSKTNSDKEDESLAAVNPSNSSEGWIQRKARRYAQAKVNAQQSAHAFARFLRLLASARLGTMKQPYSLAFHSLGNHFLHYSVTKEGAVESLGVAQNVALIAGCTGASKHVAWVEKIKPVKRVYITYTKVDTVLAAASFIDGDVKLGTNPGTELIRDSKYRYVDFENATKMKVGAHRYFVADDGKSLSKQSKLLFSRIFRSEPDFSSEDSSLRVVYPLGCDSSKTVCSMGSGIPSEG
jgi:Alpha/beta hydrolase of unknown function (DUF900)